MGHQSLDERFSDFNLSANVAIWFCLERGIIDVVLFLRRRNFCHINRSFDCRALRNRRLRLRINFLIFVVIQGRLDGFTLIILFGIHSLEISLMRLVVPSAYKSILGLLNDSYSVVEAFSRRRS